MKAYVFNNPMNGIGVNNSIPWKSEIAKDYFNVLTTGNGNNAVVIGYNTFKSLNFKPFPNRRNYIMTRYPDIVAESCGADVVFETNVENIRILDSIFDEVFVIGGETIYNLFEPFYTEIYVVTIEKYTRIDKFFLVNLVNYKKHLIKDIKENNILLSFFLYIKIPEI